MVPGHHPSLGHRSGPTLINSQPTRLSCVMIRVDTLGTLGSLNLYRSSMNQATNLAIVILI